MEEMTARKQITETGCFLLEKGLTARTWGNISCRLDEDHFLITPSGLSYTETREEDLAICKADLSEWTGPRKPSSEKGIHATAYELFPDANFVIHTHQPYASALAVYLPEQLDITEEEKNRLGGIALAGYGLPGTGKLKKAVRRAMSEGAKVVFMKNHGVVIAAGDREEALYKAELLETISERNCRKLPAGKDGGILTDSLLSAIRKVHPYVQPVRTEAVLARACAGRPIKAQLDDMAQMMGAKVPVIAGDEESILKALAKYNAILVPGLGGLVYGKDAEDSEALKLLLAKAAITANHTDGYDVSPALPALDVSLMHLVYQKKYSKLKSGASGKPAQSGKKKEVLRVVKFVLFSASAGIIEFVAFTLLTNLTPWSYWPCYLIALVLSVLWNFTFNRKFTFKSAKNVPIAMLLVFLYYLVFTPLTTLLGNFLAEKLLWNEYLVTALNMALNLSTEYLYDRFVVYRNSLDNNGNNKETSAK